MIPPTPNSIELHGRAARFPLRVDVGHDLYDHYTAINEDQARNTYTALFSFLPCIPDPGETSRR